MKATHIPMTALTTVNCLDLDAHIVTVLEQNDVFTVGVLEKYVDSEMSFHGIGMFGLSEIKQALEKGRKHGVPRESLPEPGEPSHEQVWLMAAAIRSENAGCAVRHGWMEPGEPDAGGMVEADPRGLRTVSLAGNDATAETDVRDPVRMLGRGGHGSGL